MLRKFLAVVVLATCLVAGAHAGTAGAGPVQAPDLGPSMNAPNQGALFSCMDMGVYYKCITHAGDVFYLTK